MLLEIPVDLNSIYLFANAFFLLFSVLDAVGSVPIFLALTTHVSKARHKTATESAIISFIILFLFASIGLEIFRFFGITISDFKIAGGIILFIVAVQNLIGRIPKASAKDAEDIAAFPIATPLLAGPGAISTVIIISSEPYNYFIAILAILLNCILAWAILVKSELIYRVLGRSGTNVMTRIMGLLIAAIAIAFIRGGLEASILELIKK